MKRSRFSKLDEFVTDELLDSYDKVFTKGHFALYRNSVEMNELFMKEINGHLLYKEVMQANDNRNFDEDWNGKLNANDIYRANGMRVYENVDNERKVADIYAKSPVFRVVYQNRIDHKNKIDSKRNGLFVHEDGRLRRYQMKDGQLCQEEFMYIHLKQRNMQMLSDVGQCMNFIIITDAFAPLRGKMNKKIYGYYKNKSARMNYIKLRWHNLQTKLKERLTIKSQV